MCTCGIIINLRALESHLKNLEILQKVIISNSISPNLTNCVVDNCGCYLLFPGLTIWNDDFYFVVSHWNNLFLCAPLRNLWLQLLLLMQEAAIHLIHTLVPEIVG